MKNGHGVGSVDNWILYNLFKIPVEKGEKLCYSIVTRGDTNVQVNLPNDVGPRQGFLRTEVYPAYGIEDEMWQGRMDRLGGVKSAESGVNHGC